MRASTIRLGAVALMLLLILPHTAAPSLYWQHGVRTSTISVCFVGDAVTSRPARVAEVLDHLKRFEWAANIRFEYWGSCPAPIQQPSGDSYYGGDIRVVLPYTSVAGTGPVPGQGCPAFLDANGVYNGKNDGWGSWSGAPDDLGPNRPCLYNLKLGDDPWNDTPYLNHTLHEFGHALGLAHEHERNDVDTSFCSAPGFGGSANTGFMTPYDRKSVMHYKFASCGIDGNYGRSGLSIWDRLGLHILYPEADLVAEAAGWSTIPSSKPLRLRSTWEIRGANMSYVASGFLWTLDGVPASKGTSVEVPLTIGDHSLTVSHDDFLGRSYQDSYRIRVLGSGEYGRRIVAPIGASSLP